MLGEVSQAQEDKHRMIPRTGGYLQDSKSDTGGGSEVARKYGGELVLNGDGVPV